MNRDDSRCRSIEISTGSRGVSETFSVVLLIAITVVGTTALLAFGGPVLDRNKKAAEVGQAEHALSQFDSQASRVALGDGSVQAVDLGLTASDGSLQVRPDSGWLRVDYVNATDGTAEPVVNTSLGAVTYDRGGTTVAYQGGGVWRTDGNGSTMVSRPEFHFRDDTLTLPIVRTEGGGSVHSDVEITRAGPPVRAFPDRTAGWENKLNNSKVRVTVHSEYYDAWGRYFEERTGGQVFVDHARETATVVFLAVPRTIGLESGIIATSGSGLIKLGGEGVYIDSYDEGSYDGGTPNGDLTAVNDVHSTGSADVDGDVRSGSVVDLSGTTDITGTVYWTDDFQRDGAAVGDDEQIRGVASIPPIDGYVYDTVASARASNDNSEYAFIEDNEITGSGTLQAGTYYLHDLTLGPGDSLTLDTSDGNLTIAVRDYVHVEGKGQKASQTATVDVVGNGTVEVVVAGEGRSPDAGKHFVMGKNSQIDVPEENSRQFRIYGTKSFDGQISSDNSPSKLRFEGVVYAPAGLYGTGSLYIQQAEFYGGMVAGSLTIKQYAEIHYDESLADAQFPRAPTVSRIEYLHVTVHRINVTDV